MLKQKDNKAKWISPYPEHLPVDAFLEKIILSVCLCRQLRGGKGGRSPNPNLNLNPNSNSNSNSGRVTHGYILT